MTLLVMRLFFDMPVAPCPRDFSILPRPKPLFTSCVQRYLKTKIATANSPLESLPVEIWDQILSLLDLEQLRNLVHASPIIHGYYRCHRIPLLLSSLQISLQGILLRITIKHPYRVSSLDEGGTWVCLFDFRLVTYVRWCDCVLPLVKEKRLTRLDIIDTATFFFYFALPLAHSYAECSRVVNPDSVKRFAAEVEGNRSGNSFISRGKLYLDLFNQTERDILEGFATHLQCFDIGCGIWRQYYGLGFLKRAVRESEILKFKHSYESDTMVFDSD